MTLFYERLTALCQENDIPVSRVLQALDMSHTTAVSWKTKDTLPNSKTISKIARYFNVNEGWLKGETEERTFYGEENLVGIDKALLTALRALTPQQIALVKAYIQGLTT